VRHDYFFASKGKGTGGSRARQLTISAGVKQRPINVKIATAGVWLIG